MLAFSLRNSSRPSFPVCAYFISTLTFHHRQQERCRHPNLQRNIQRHYRWTCSFQINPKFSYSTTLFSTNCTFLYVQLYATSSPPLSSAQHALTRSKRALESRITQITPGSCVTPPTPVSCITKLTPKSHITKLTPESRITQSTLESRITQLTPVSRSTARARLSWHTPFSTFHVGIRSEALGSFPSLLLAWLVLLFFSASPMRMYSTFPMASRSASSSTYSSARVCELCVLCVQILLHPCRSDTLSTCTCVCVCKL